MSGLAYRMRLTSANLASESFASSGALTSEMPFE